MSTSDVHVVRSEALEPDAAKVLPSSLQAPSGRDASFIAKYKQIQPITSSSSGPQQRQQLRRDRTQPSIPYNHSKRHQHSVFLTGAHAAAAVNAAREKKKVSQLDDLFDFDLVS